MKIIRNAPRDVFPFQASPEAEGYFPDTSPVTPSDLRNLPESADTMGHQSPGESLTSVDSSPLDLSVRGLSMHIVNFHITLVNMADVVGPTVPVGDLSLLRRQWPVSVVSGMSRNQNNTGTVMLRV